MIIDYISLRFGLGDIAAVYNYVEERSLLLQHATGLRY